jgi:hypothetical protein
MLQSAFTGLKADIQPLLQIRASTDADHVGTRHRSPYAKLPSNTLLQPCTTPVRATIMVFDDVLTTGKHFQVAHDLLVAALPNIRFVGLFLTRCRISAQRSKFSPQLD